MILGIVCISVPAFITSGYESSWASRVCIFCMWAFFVPVFAYYKGALKMFFNSEVSLPFETLDQVLEVFPTWNLIMKNGLESNFKIPATQVIWMYFDSCYNRPCYINNINVEFILLLNVTVMFQGIPNYVKYWKAVEGDKPSFLTRTVFEGLTRLEEEQTVFFVTNSLLKGAIKKNPKIGQNLKTFGKTKTRYNCMMLNKNSPFSVDKYSLCCCWRYLRTPSILLDFGGFDPSFKNNATFLSVLSSICLFLQ